MIDQLVECIPNFSEARREDVINAIIASITSVGGVSLLDRHSDLDHNRTVLTIAGHPEKVEEAVFRAIKQAAETIDMDQHTGEHPRLGATDVVPFVPLRNLSMQDCVAIARRLGQRVAIELDIPVYLYEEAATRPENHNLENIRKGQYEGLKTEIQTDPQRKPDFGPAVLGKAGATVIGARQPLIAYNIYLNSTDITLAQKIAKAVRHSSGGFRYVKALGMLVDGLAQVSMNLTNFRSTPVARVHEAVRREALALGVSIHHAELVGLVPQDAILDAAQWYLQLHDFSGSQILENNLAAEPGSILGETISNDLLDRLASPAPTPGGGSAGAHVAAVAAALVTMVARLTVGKKKYADVTDEFEQIISVSEGLRAKLSQAVDDDAHAFNRYMDALQLPKDSPEQVQARQLALDDALRHAATVPLEVARSSVKVLELALSVSQKGNVNAISDAGSAAEFAVAAFNVASMNVRINLSQLKDDAGAKEMLGEMEMLQKTVIPLKVQVDQSLSSRVGL